ncbi:myoblast fusion [Sparganum proliferum]
MFGDITKGEHNLRISNISEEDAGEYECQVTPVENLEQPLLRRRTYLTVLVIPSHPEMKVNDLPLPKDELIISQPDPDPRAEVACYARNGVPPPDFVWLLNDINLNELTNTSTTPGEAEKTTESISGLVFLFKSF